VGTSFFRFVTMTDGQMDRKALAIPCVRLHYMQSHGKKYILTRFSERLIVPLDTLQVFLYIKIWRNCDKSDGTVASTSKSDVYSS